MTDSAVLDERSGSIKQSRFSQKWIVYDIRPAESRTAISDLNRQLSIGKANLHTRKMKYAHLGMSELRRLRQVEEENAQLKWLVEDVSVISDWPATA